MLARVLRALWRGRHRRVSGPIETEIMKLIECDMCHVTFHSASTDAEAARRFEAEHHVDHGSVETVPVCPDCAATIRRWWTEVGQYDPTMRLGGQLH